MSEWKNCRSAVYEDRHGNARCGACSTALFCNDCGDMPSTCPGCGAPLSYDSFSPSSATTDPDNIRTISLSFPVRTDSVLFHLAERYAAAHNMTPEAVISAAAQLGIVHHIERTLRALLGGPTAGI